MLKLLLKFAKFTLKKSVDLKVQNLWANYIQGNENNKLILRYLGKIIFVYSHANQFQRFRFSSKLIKIFMMTFLKDKNKEIRKYFAFSMK